MPRLQTLVAIAAASKPAPWMNTQTPSVISRIAMVITGVRNVGFSSLIGINGRASRGREALERGTGRGTMRAAGRKSYGRPAYKF